MKAISAFFPLMPLCLFLCGCNLFNLSVPEYIDKYTNSAAGEEIESFSPVPIFIKTDQSRIIPPGIITQVKVRLRNPRRYDLIPVLELIGESNYTNLPPPDNLISMEYIAPDLIIIRLGNDSNSKYPQVGDVFHLLLKIKDADTGREFPESYILPRIKCNNFPQLVTSPKTEFTNAEKTLTISWKQELGGTEQDPRFLQVNTVINGSAFIDTFTRITDPASRADTWIGSSRTIAGTLSASSFPAEGSYGITFTSAEPITSYSCTLLFRNGDELEREWNLNAEHLVKLKKHPDDGTARYFGNLEDALVAVQAGEIVEIILLGTIQTGTRHMIDGNREIRLYANQDRILEFTGTGNLFTLDGGAKLVLGDGNNSLHLKGHAGNNASLIRMNAGSSLEMNDRVSISGNTADNGGAVYMNGTGSTFTMHGGSISGNTAANYGGAVYINSEAVFSMNGGTIGGTGLNDSNSAGMGGGAVYANSGKIILEADAAITGNTSTAYGGGIAGIFRTEITVKDNSRISKNNADTNGGGIYLNGTSAKLIMEGGSIGGAEPGMGNAAGSGGGGVYINGSVFTMGGGSANITGNEAENGGGVYANSGKITMSGDAGITGNNATSGGGGIYGTNDATFDMMGSSKVIGNNAQGTGILGFEYSGGGGVCMNGGSITMKGNSGVSGNHSNSSHNEFGYGGGIFIKGTLILMENAVINDNNASKSGGGITLHYATATIEDNVIISGNKVVGCGGGICGLAPFLNLPDDPPNNHLSLNGGTIQGNEASSGGGIYIPSKTEFSMNGSATKISGNRATGTDSISGGGGLYIAEDGTGLTPPYYTNMDGGTIGGTNPGDENTAIRGGGLYIGYATFIMKPGSGAKITGNKATSANGGSGVYVRNGGTFNQNSCTVSGNTPLPDIFYEP